MAQQPLGRPPFRGAGEQPAPTLFCESCKASPARSFCHADAARLCLNCDKKVLTVEKREIR